MKIGVPKEIKNQEHRVALLPSAAYQLVKNGHEVIVHPCSDVNVTPWVHRMEARSSR